MQAIKLVRRFSLPVLYRDGVRFVCVSVCPCVSRLPPVSFYRYRVSRVCPGSPGVFLPVPGTAKRRLSINFVRNRDAAHLCNARARCHSKPIRACPYTTWLGTAQICHTKVWNRRVCPPEPWQLRSPAWVFAPDASESLNGEGQTVCCDDLPAILGKTLAVDGAVH